MATKKRILVVDDTDKWLRVIEHILTDDYELSLFADPSQAKKAFAEDSFDLLILDKNLPAESAGLELLKYFRQSKPNLRAIILTEFADVASAVKSMKLGALDYVPKYTKNLSDVLRAKVEEALALSTEPVDAAIISLINKGESKVLEFKTSLRWDTREKKVNKELEKVIAKTIAGFLNSDEEGSLLIGVDDSGTVAGIENDYQTLGRRQDRDAFENLLMTIALDGCGKDSVALIKIVFHRVSEKDICQVLVKPSPKPIFVKDDKGEHLYVRTGNSTRLLNTREALEYCKLRWKN
jgi:ActR/RegA family two-component response regulator